MAQADPHAFHLLEVGGLADLRHEFIDVLRMRQLLQLLVLAALVAAAMGPKLNYPFRAKSRCQSSSSPNPAGLGGATERSRESCAAAQTEKVGSRTALTRQVLL